LWPVEIDAAMVDHGRRRAPLFAWSDAKFCLSDRQSENRGQSFELAKRPQMVFFFFDVSEKIDAAIRTINIDSIAPCNR
jgi:hypothetical protein